MMEFLTTEISTSTQGKFIRNASHVIDKHKPDTNNTKCRFKLTMSYEATCYPNKYQIKLVITAFLSLSLSLFMSQIGKVLLN
jgi:hypothetical protein